MRALILMVAVLALSACGDDGDDLTTNYGDEVVVNRDVGEGNVQLDHCGEVIPRGGQGTPKNIPCR